MKAWGNIMIFMLFLLSLGEVKAQVITEDVSAMEKPVTLAHL